MRGVLSAASTARAPCGAPRSARLARPAEGLEGLVVEVAAQEQEVVGAGLARGDEDVGGLDVAERVRDRLVFGTNVAQTWHFATSGAAELGFVALSQALARDAEHRVVPDRFHRPVLQDAVLLAHARDRDAASGFLEFLRTDPEVAKIVLALGYAPADGR